MSQEPAALPRPFVLRAEHNTRDGQVPAASEVADDFNWLRDDARSHPDVLGYLRAENTYAHEHLERLGSLVDQLCCDMDAGVPEVEESGAWLQGRHLYVRQRRPGQQHWDLVRRPAPPSAAAAPQGSSSGAAPGGAGAGGDELVLPCNQLAGSREFWELTDSQVSPDGRLVAYAVDETGAEHGTLHVRLVSSGAGSDGSGGAGRELPLQPLRYRGSLVWARDSARLFFVGGSGQQQEVMCLHLGQDRGAGSSAAGEASAIAAGGAAALQLPAGAGPDLKLWGSQDGRYLLVRASGPRVNPSLLAWDLGQAAAAAGGGAGREEGAAGWRAVLPPGLDADCLAADHLGAGAFLLVTDTDEAPDGALTCSSLGGAGGPGALQVVVPHETGAQLCGFRLLPAGGGGGGAGGGSGAAPAAATLAVLVSAHATSRVVVYGVRLAAPAAGGQAPVVAERLLTVPFEAGLVVELGRVGPPLDGGSEAGGGGSLQLVLSSPTRPDTLVSVDLATGLQAVVHAEPVGGSFDAGAYASTVAWAPSPPPDDAAAGGDGGDCGGGVQVPVSLAYRRDLLRADGSNPLLLQVYGAYGARIWPRFNPADLALLDRGWLLATAHVRGGGELGSAWHRAGMRRHKGRSSADLAAALRHLHGMGHSSLARTVLWCRSAGGLAVGHLLNSCPGLAVGALLDVPFLDPLGTLLDPDLALVARDWREFGDPGADPAVFAQLHAQSPYGGLRLHGAAGGSCSDGADAAAPGEGASAPGGQAGAGSVSMGGYRYPALLVTAALHDPRVNFWEPAKYMARLRQLRAQAAEATTRGPAAAGAGGPPLRQLPPALLLTELGPGGHFGASGAGRRLLERARKLAFAMEAVGSGGL